MLRIHSKRFLIRLITISLFLFFVMHYTWLYYHTFIQQEIPSVLEHSNHNSQTKYTTRQAQRVNSNTVPRCESPVFLLIIVMSAPKDFEQRSIIRSTWATIKDTDPDITNIVINGSYTGYHNLVKTVFLVGQTDKNTRNMIETESKYYNDLVIGSFVDSYGNLTLKLKLGLEWALQQLCKFKYFMKTDDDIFVYSKGLVKWLWQLPREGVYTGRCSFNKKVPRYAGNKWSLSKQKYRKSNYPPYCSGMGYIISSDVFQNLMLIEPTQPFFIWEDVYVGQILKKLRIVPVDNKQYFKLYNNFSYHVCRYKNMLLNREVSPKNILEMHLKFSNLWKCGPVDYLVKV